MKATRVVYCILFIFTMASCQSEDEKALRDKLASAPNVEIAASRPLSSAIIQEYKEAEIAINQRYVSQIQKIVDEEFDEKLDRFEDKEFGFFRSYKHMFKVLLNDNQEMTDYWNLKQLKYFSTTSTQQRLHDEYMAYNNDIQKLRNQISKSPKCKAIPKEVIFNLPDQTISLNKMTEHSYKNLAIEFGTDIAIWLLCLLIVAILSFSIGFMGSIPAWIVTLVTIIASILLSIWNDNSMMNSIREQRAEEVRLDYTSVLNQLDKSTNDFYDYLSK